MAQKLYDIHGQEIPEHLVEEMLRVPEDEAKKGHAKKGHASKKEAEPTINSQDLDSSGNPGGTQGSELKDLMNLQEGGDA